MRTSTTPGGSTLTASTPSDSSWPRSVAGEELLGIGIYLRERFGVPPDVLEGFCFWERGGTYYALSGSAGSVGDLSGLRVVAVGLPLVRRVTKYLKPTSPALRMLAPWVIRNRVSLKHGEALRLLAKGEIPWSMDASEGYVLLETEDTVLGCGLMLPGRLLSQIARSEVQAFGLSS